MKIQGNGKVFYKEVDFDPFAEVENISVPTTEPQREIWTNVQIGGHSANCAYNESVSLHLDGDFNVEFIKSAVHLLFERHAALRSVFSDDGLLMTITPQVKIEIPLIDLSGFDQEKIRESVSKILNNEAEHSFDLANGPLGKVTVIRLGRQKHQLILTFHHIVCDGWSLGIMMQDLGKMYSAIKRGDLYLDEPALSFVDYAGEELVFSESSASREIENYWLNQFKDEIPSFELPINKSRPAFRTYNANRIDREVDPVLIQTIKKIGAKQGTSFVATLVAAFEVFLYRITGSSDIIVGLATAGQSLDGNQNLVGHCVNLLPLKSKINPNVSFNEYLQLRKPQILDAYDNQRYTFGKLIQKLNIPRDPSRIPLVPVSFNVDVGITNGVEFEGCTYTFSTNPRHYENFEIFINAAGSGNEMTLECTFNVDLFEEPMMVNRLHEFVQLLESIASSPDSRIGFLNILNQDENQWMNIHCKAKTTNYPDNSIIAMFEKTVASHHNAIALEYEGRKISYRQLDERSNQLAAFLISNGVGPETKVAIYCERSVEMIISILGILKAGGAYVPIDLSYPPDRVTDVLNDAGTSVVITQKRLTNSLGSGNELVLCTEDFEDLLKNQSPAKPVITVSPTNSCYIIYTSGSTGKPKGVIIENYTLVNYISWCNEYYFGNREMGNFGLYSSLSFDLTVTSIYSSLTRGKTLTIFNQFDEVPDILKSSFGPDTRVDTIKMTPAHVLVLENLQLKTSKIKKAIVGGEELTPRHVEILHAINPQMEIVNEYGPTEATVGCVIKDIVQPSDALTIGKPIDNCEIYILDQLNQPLPPGIPGRLFIAGGGLARGYHNRTSLSDEKFQILTLNGESLRTYDSGDLARYRLNGEIDFLGRIDDQVKVRGYRIELGEIESQILNLQFVKQQVVMVREDEPGNKNLVAYIVLKDGYKANQSDIRNELSKQLPDFMIPSAFVFMDQFALTVNGKIDKKALPAPGKSGKQYTERYEEPQTPTEEALVNIWCSVLGLEKVGRKDNFFELGGHSIIAVKLFNEVQKQLGINVQLSMIFRAPTIEELAKILNKEVTTKPWSCLVPLQAKGNNLPLFCIHMHNGNIHRWRVLVKHLGNDQPVYAIQPRGLDEKQEPHYSIEEMAAYYIDVIKTVQPHGPYNLLGLCFSGMVAFEMAAQLQKMGDQISFLGMVNNYAPPENPSIYRLKTGLNKFMKMEMGEKFQYALQKNRSVGKNLLFVAKKIINTPGQQEQTEVQDETESVGHDLRTIHSLALLHYHPEHVFEGNLVIIRNAEPIEPFYNELLGWDRLIKGKIETTIIEGSDNDTIITDEPFNALLSLKVKEYLDHINA